MLRRTIQVIVYILVIVSMAPGFVAAMGGGDMEAVEAFYEKGDFTYCDAKMVASAWGMSTFDAKIAFGEKILNGNLSFAKSQMMDTRATAKKKGTSCDFYEGPYDYQDFEVVAKLWGVNVSQAKSKVATFLTNGQRSIVDEALKAKAVIEKKVNPVSVFLAKYNYCDAKVVANEWGEEEAYEVKIMLGEAMNSGNGALVTKVIASARKRDKTAGLTCD